MKNALFLVGLILFICSCSVKKLPIFLKVDDIKILSFSSDTIRLQANAYFQNPNDVGGKIFTDNILIFVNNVEVAQVVSDEFKVPAKNDFLIPLIAKIATKSILSSDKNGILGGLINSFLTKKLNIRIKGKLDYVVFGFKKEFLVDKTQEIKINF
jgi:hypothetical protein